MQWCCWARFPFAKFHFNSGSVSGKPRFEFHCGLWCNFFFFFFFGSFKWEIVPNELLFVLIHISLLSCILNYYFVVYGCELSRLIWHGVPIVVVVFAWFSMLCGTIFKSTCLRINLSVLHSTLNNFVWLLSLWIHALTGLWKRGSGGSRWLLWWVTERMYYASVMGSCSLQTSRRRATRAGNAWMWEEIS